MIGPYSIIAQEGHSFCVQLLESMKIHPVFAPNLLRKDKGKLLPGQIQESEPPLQVTDNYKWEVQKILAVKQTRNKLWYCVNQLEYNKDPEWYSASNFKYAPHKLKAFHLYYSNLPGPLHKLTEQLQAWEKDRDNYNKLNNNKVASQCLQISFFRRRG